MAAPKRKSKSKLSGSANRLNAGSGGEGTIQNTVLQEELESRFLSYALSTIVSRALPDVRDGLKPVHRRVLYAMSQLRLGFDARFRKSAAVVGDVIGKYHPHGDQAVYDTMVRLAQDFSLRYPLVEGQGNFGNIDGDSAAAMRYTEARLSKLAGELTAEMKMDTVEFAPTYDGTQSEPRLMPARFPNLLANGSSGIAVGLATNIPPHNLKETIDAAIMLIDRRGLTTMELLKYIKGPDFPTGGQIIASKKELCEAYDSGKGSITVRGEWEEEKLARGKKNIVITSIPYTVNKSRLIEKIADLIISKKLPAIVDVRDESTETIRIVLEPKAGETKLENIVSYIYKKTDLQINFAMNLTALTPDATPLRHSLRQMLKSFIDFRFDVTGKRLNYDLRLIKARLHILRALMKVYKELDKAIAIIRTSKTRDEAKQKLIKYFVFDDTQANAILDLRLSALVGLEISKIKIEKAEKEAQREIIEGVLKSKSKLWKLVKKELKEIKEEYGDKRRSQIISAIKDGPEYHPESFIEHEDTHVIVSNQGWVRRMKSVADPQSLRFKEGDSLMAWIPMNTRDVVCFFSSAGKFYAISANDIIATTGFGAPIQSMFKFMDGERVVSVVGLIKQNSKERKTANDPGGSKQGGLFDKTKKSDFANVFGQTIEEEFVWEFLVVSEGGSGFRFSSEILAETNKNGKKYANVKRDDAIFNVILVSKPSIFILASDGRGLKMKLKEVPVLSGPGAGARLMKIKPGARVIGVRNLGRGDFISLLYASGRDDKRGFADVENGARGTVGRMVASRKKKLIGLAIG
ncbi:DNA gyrase subunit A [hydrothermal vent metagenome]|uniref:DNA topoisomerase (ATP-hydrolyzing) n=1 Tax=hydrothermal vent metagenome TaxID=652676 RepID=A0A3B1CTK3_9ZZZZ